jgi:hypothetical protein
MRRARQSPDGRAEVTVIRPLPVLALSALLATTAASANPRVLPTAPIVGDGATPATLQILVPPGARPKITASRGTIDAITPVAGGLLVTWTPPALATRETVAILVRLRGGGVSEDFEIPVEVLPSWTGSFDVKLDTDAVGAGQGATVKVRPSSTGPTDAPRTLRATVSAGTLGNLVPSSDGSFAARYTAPARITDPAWAVFAIADDAAPSTFVGAGALPITTTRSLTFDAPADQMAVLKVGDREYGPVKASPSGKVAFDVDLHPGRRSGTLTVTGAAASTRTVELPFQAAGGLAVAPLPAKAGGGTVLTVPVACRTGAGQPCTPNDVTFEVSDGSVGAAIPRGDLLLVPWTLPDTGAPSFTARLGDASSTVRVTTLPSPLSLTLTSNPPTLAPGQTDVDITVRAKDPGGRSAPGRMPAVEVRGARSVKRTVDNKDGTYTGTWRLDAQAPWVEAVASAPLGATGLAPQRLVAWPTVDAIAADGASVISFFVVAEDAAGMPVPNIPLELAVPTGDAVVAPTARTDANGVARIDLKIGRQPGLVVVQARGAGLVAVGRLWQSTPEAPPPALPPLGSGADIDALGRWRDRVAALYVGRGATAVVVAPTAPTPGTPVATAPTGVPGGTPGATPGAMPGAVAGSTGGGGRAPSANAGDLSKVRLRAMLSNAPFAWSSTLRGEGASTFAPEASFTTSPIFGHTAAHGEVELWPDAERRLGLDLRARAGIYRVKLGSTSAAVAPLELEGGVRYRAWSSGKASAYAGGGFGRSQGLVIAYTDDTRSSADPVNFAVLGARVGGGLRVESGPTLFELDLQTFWTPAPSIFRLDSRLDVPLAGNLALSFALGGDARLLRYKIDDTDARVRTRQFGGDLRAGIAVPFF